MLTGNLHGKYHTISFIWVNATSHALAKVFLNVPVATRSVLWTKDLWPPLHLHRSRENHQLASFPPGEQAGQERKPVLRDAVWQALRLSGAEE